MKFHLPLPGRRLRRILTLLGQAALCCVLTAARLGGLYAPFSLAAAAAAGPGLPGLLSLLGVTGGALLFLDFQPGLRHAAAAVLLFAAQTAFCDTKFYRRPALPAPDGGPLPAADPVGVPAVPPPEPVGAVPDSLGAAGGSHGSADRPRHDPPAKGLLYAAALSLALALVPVTVGGSVLRGESPADGGAAAPLPPSAAPDSGTGGGLCGPCGGSGTGDTGAAADGGLRLRRERWPPSMAVCPVSSRRRPFLCPPSPLQCCWMSVLPDSCCCHVWRAVRPICCCPGAGCLPAQSVPPGRMHPERRQSPGGWSSPLRHCAPCTTASSGTRPRPRRKIPQ